MTIILFVHGL